MKKDKKRKFNLNFGNTVLILVATLILIAVLIIAIYVRSNQVTPLTENIENLNQQSDNSNSAKPNDYPGAAKLLAVLPYRSVDFTANYLTLEKDSKPKIVVTYLTDLGEAKFKEWIDTVVFDPLAVEFEYIPIQVFEVFE